MWDDSVLNGTAELVGCKSCGMLFNDTLDEETDFERYYADDDYYAVADSAGAGAVSEQEQMRYLRIFETFSDYLSTDKPCLVDMGAGQGGFLKWCQSNKQVEAIAVEMSEACAYKMRNELSIPVYKKFTDIERKDIDIIVMSHVMEHLFQPDEVLKSIVDEVSGQTLFYIEVPNAACYLIDENPWKHLYFEHINHFDALHLDSFIRSFGLEPVAQGNRSFSPGSGDDKECVFVLCKKSSTTQRGSDMSLLHHAKTSFLDNSSLFHMLEKQMNLAKSISIWGASQYVQLLLGSSELLRDNIRFLVDKSSAKCGRMMGGIEVKPPLVLSDLGVDDLLLIPHGPYVQNMRMELEKMNFQGDVLEF